MDHDRMPAPVPASLTDEFLGYMSASEQHDVPDGAWFQILEDAARSFLRSHGLKVDANDAAHQYLRLCSEQQGEHE